MEKFILGLAAGMVGGALIVANNCKVRNLVKKNGDEIMTKLQTYIDQKMQEMGCDGASSQSEGESQSAEGGSEQPEEE
jgi:hypothetical protein